MLRRWKSHVCFPYIFGISAAYEGCSESNTPILWCWWYGSRGWTFPCCCCVTDGSRGEVWQNGVWHGSVYEAKVCRWVPPRGRNCIHWHSLMLAEHWWRPNSEHSEGWVVHFSSGDSMGWGGETFIRCYLFYGSWRLLSLQLYAWVFDRIAKTATLGKVSAKDTPDYQHLKKMLKWSDW